jgi:hypothetical protein
MTDVILTYLDAAGKITALTFINTASRRPAPMLFSVELAKLSIDERRRDVDAARLVSLARRIADCCKPATLRMRVAAAIRSAADACCPSDQERMIRAIRSVTGA